MLLEHEPAGEAAHLDLMIAPAGVVRADVRAGRVDRDARVVRTYRLDERVDETVGLDGCVRRVGGVLLPDHRLHYLDFEGAMSGGRGRVRAVAHGRGRWEDAAGGFARLWLDLRCFSGVYGVFPVRTGGVDGAREVSVVIERA